MNPRHNRILNLTGFWLLGLCNNYGYVVMLSAAFDLLKKDYHSDEQASQSSNQTTTCNPVSTGAVLIADIIPSLSIKLIAPFLSLSTHFKVLLVITLSAASFLLTALSLSPFMTYCGIVCASLSSGLGEVTFLGYSSLFDPNVVSTWSSGTGGAGLLGSFSYAGLTSFGLSPRNTLLVMLIVPLLMAFTFWSLIVPPPKRNSEREPIHLSHSSSPDLEVLDDDKSSKLTLSFGEKILVLKKLLKFMIPLGLVYYFEYFINQGLFEILYFANTSLEHAEQYRWYQVIYQAGVLISRSSVNIFKIKYLWLLPILQGLNVLLLLIQILSPFIPFIYIVFGIILYEGLLGGAAYVNTFYRISVESSPRHKEFSMSVTTLADSTGIMLAGFTSIPAHNALCFCNNYGYVVMLSATLDLLKKDYHSDEVIRTRVFSTLTLQQTSQSSNQIITAGIKLFTMLVYLSLDLL
ncbi:Battenin-like protein [Dinothrombium tinctorium]|uniref:Battenin n=1 Tax=Dinothrombium tinctorium TaxID=1965070 RepID=A0A443RR17_9ACAR|nr:Battenin-like protein [Dinothrombium tinctorium]